MAPYATAILMLPALLWEGVDVLKCAQRQNSLGLPVVIIISSGFFAFCLNFSIFHVIHSTTAVTFNVAGNMKVAVAIIVSWIIFKNPISPWNAIGCTITLLGCTFYGYTRHRLAKDATKVLEKEETIHMLPIVNTKSEQL